jgi:hypothetical protein
MKTGMDELLEAMRGIAPETAESPKMPDGFAARIVAEWASCRRIAAKVWLRASVAGACAAVLAAGWIGRHPAVDPAADLAEVLMNLEPEMIE